MDTGISTYAAEYLAEVRTLLDRFPRAQLERVTAELLAAHGRGSRIYIMGNGGSAATASHFACDLAKGCSVGGRPGFRVSSLTDAVPTLTAIANDLAYEEIFREQLRTLLEPSDVVVAISTSGNSPNVLRALEYGRSCGAVTIGFLGFDGGKAKDLVDACILINSFDYGHVEHFHSMVTHLIAQYLAQHLRRSPSAGNRTHPQRS